VSCTGLGGEEGEDAGAAADVEDSLAGEDVGVADNGRLISSGSDFIFEHFFVDAEVSVRVCVIICSREIILYIYCGEGRDGGVELGGEVSRGKRDGEVSLNDWISLARIKKVVMQITYWCVFGSVFHSDSFSKARLLKVLYDFNSILVFSDRYSTSLHSRRCFNGA